MNRGVVVVANVGEYVVVGVGDGAYVVYAVVLVVYGGGGVVYGEGEVKVKRMVVGWPPMVVERVIT